MLRVVLLAVVSMFLAGSVPSSAEASGKPGIAARAKKPAAKKRKAAKKSKRSKRARKTRKKKAAASDSSEPRRPIP